MDQAKATWEEIYTRTDLPWVKNPIPFDILNKFCKYFKEGDRILDYGGGDGVLSEIISAENLNVTCSDISDTALSILQKRNSSIKTIQASSPADLLKFDEKYKGILVWGVMHHVQKEEWQQYLHDFYALLDKDGIMLLAGHSNKDLEFASGHRISPTSGLISYAVNDIEKNILKSSFEIIESGYFEFKEAFTDSHRVFKYFLVKK